MAYSKVLTTEEIEQIRNEYKVVERKAVNIIELAKRYNVTQGTIRRYALGQRTI
jgi:DeoR/GlpR family transcriptional regulator of sugar metabolism